MSISRPPCCALAANGRRSARQAMSHARVVASRRLIRVIPGSGSGLAEGDRMAVKMPTRMNGSPVSAVFGPEVEVQGAVEDPFEAGIGQRLGLAHRGLHRAAAEVVIGA